jgi:streptogramin lyase
MNLPPALDQVMSSGVPAGLCVLADSGFSFGTAVGTNGEVYVTDFPGQKINRYNPADGSMTVVVSNRPAVYGVAADDFGNLFYAQDSDSGAGKVTRRTPGGSETEIISGLTRPRQLTTDSAGNLYVALEAAR